MNHDLSQKFRLFKFFISQKDRKLQKNSFKIVVILQNFGRFLSLRPEKVLISPNFPNYRVFRKNLFISEIDQSLGSIWHFPQKSSPKKQSSTLFFLKNQKMQEYFSIIVFVCTGARAIVVAEKFSTIKNFLSLTNLFRILLCIED